MPHMLTEHDPKQSDGQDDGKAMVLKVPPLDYVTEETDPLGKAKGPAAEAVDVATEAFGPGILAGLNP
ncbi:MAG: hypothetical protein ACI92I_000089 [Acidimicrobiales bacterium]|jgi:hypothetical protein